MLNILLLTYSYICILIYRVLFNNLTVPVLYLKQTSVGSIWMLRSCELCQTFSCITTICLAHCGCKTLYTPHVSYSYNSPSKFYLHSSFIL